MTFSNSGLPYPVRASGDTIEQIELPGVPLGSFGGSTYDEVSVDLKTGDLFVFCSDGIFETFNAAGEEFGSQRIIKAVRETTATSPPRKSSSAIFGAMQAFRGDARADRRSDGGGGEDHAVKAVKVRLGAERASGASSAAACCVATVRCRARWC